MLKEKIQNNAKEALKNKEQFRLGVLRLVLAAIATKEKEKKFKEKIEGEANLSDEEVIDVISFEIKKRKDAILLYNQGNRPELAEKEEKEIEIIKNYLPEQLSEDEIKKIIKEAVEKTGAKEMRDMGKVMAEINPKIKGKADGGEVSKIVKEILLK